MQVLHELFHHGLHEGQQLLGAESDPDKDKKEYRRMVDTKSMPTSTKRRAVVGSTQDNVRQVGIAHGVEYLVGVVNRQPMRRIASHQSAHQFLRGR